MTSLLERHHELRRWSALLAAALALVASAPAYAADKSLAACLAEMGTITGTTEGVNLGVDAAAEAADVGLPVMDIGIVLSLNQVNANLADLLAPLTTTAKSTCDTNETISSSASTTDFIGWTDAEDSEPQPEVIPTQIDGMFGLASPLARTADTENIASVKKMEANFKDGYSSALIDSELKGLANMEGIGLTGIASEKLALLAAPKNLEKLKTASNMKDLTAMTAILLNQLAEDIMRSNIISQQQEVGANQRERFHVNERQMIHDDHMAVAKMLSVGV